MLPQGMDPRYMNYPYGGPVMDNRNMPNQMMQENQNMMNIEGNNRNSKERKSYEKKPSSEKIGQVQIHDAGLMDKLNNENNKIIEEKPAKVEKFNPKDTTIIDVNNAQLDQLNVSSFIKNIEGDDKKLHFDAISDVNKKVIGKNNNLISLQKITRNSRLL